MNYQERLSILAILLMTSTIGLANPSSEVEERDRLQALRAGTAKKMGPSPLERAYLDAYSVLGSNDSCGQFFGGKGSRLVLEAMVMNLRMISLNTPGIGIRMSGPFTTLVDSHAGVSYRLFEQAEINRIGAFYKSKIFPAEPLVPNVGSFRPNTREARTLILLHELAHLVRGRDSRWLIPDDGNNVQLSRANTMIVESKCGRQIRAL
jgi:hypothetical protein